MEQLGVYTGSCICLIFMCKFIAMVYSPGSKKVFFTTFGWYLRTLLSCSFYFKAKIQNCSLLWLDSHCRCNTLTFMYGEYMPLAQNLTTFQTWLVMSPYDLVLFSHTDCHSFQVCYLDTEGERLVWCTGKFLCFLLIENVGNVTPGILFVGHEEGKREGFSCWHSLLGSQWCVECGKIPVVEGISLGSSRVYAALSLVAWVGDPAHPGFLASWLWASVFFSETLMIWSWMLLITLLTWCFTVIL